jgi:putative oxidoreductase
MKKYLFSTGSNKFIESIWMLVLRICSGAFMLTHGIPKFNKILDGDWSFADPLGVGEEISLLLAVFAEVLGAALLMLGLFTRPAALILSATMAVAAFIQHADDPFKIKEKALLYLLIYITVLVFGPGKYSVDKLVK